MRLVVALGVAMVAMTLSAQPSEAIDDALLKPCG